MFKLLIITNMSLINSLNSFKTKVWLLKFKAQKVIIKITKQNIAIKMKMIFKQNNILVNKLIKPLFKSY